MDQNGSWVRVASTDDIPEQGMIGIRVGEMEIALYRLSADEFCATDNICTHEFALLTDGWLEAADGVVECPLHAGQFNVRTGKGLCDPINKDLPTFQTRVEGSDLLVLLPV